MNTRKWPLQLAIWVSIAMFFPWDYGVYMVGNTILFSISMYYCYQLYSKNRERQNPFFWYFLIAGIIYNPLLPIHLFYRTLWITVDLIYVLICWSHYSKLKEMQGQKQLPKQIPCAKCGKKNNGEYNFCNVCGTILKK